MEYVCVLCPVKYYSMKVRGGNRNDLLEQLSVLHVFFCGVKLFIRYLMIIIRKFEIYQQLDVLLCKVGDRNNLTIGFALLNLSNMNQKGK